MSPRVKPRIKRDEAAASKPTPTTDRLLYSRQQVADLLGGICVMTVVRLEQKGVLKPVRLDKNARRVFYTRENVLALTQGEQRR